MVPWKRGDWRETVQRLKWPAAIAIVLAVVLPFALHGRTTLLAATGALFGSWAIFAAAQDVWRRVRAKPDLRSGISAVPRAVWGMTLAHIGLGIWAIGVSGVISFGDEKDVRLVRGAETELGGYSFRFEEAGEQAGPNYTAQQATVTVERNGKLVATLHPQKRLFPSQGTVLTQSSIDAGLMRDLYVSLGESYDDGSWSLRVYYKPVIRMIWLGGIFMFFGGLLAASDRRYRLARAAERRAEEVAAAAVA